MNLSKKDLDKIKMHMAAINAILFSHIEINNMSVCNFYPVETVTDAAIRAVVECTGIHYNKINGRDRHKHIMLARHILRYIIRQNTSLTYKQIGKIAGRSDHSTVVVSVNQIKNWIETDEEIRKLYNCCVNRFDELISTESK